MRKEEGREGERGKRVSGAVVSLDSVEDDSTLLLLPQLMRLANQDEKREEAHDVKVQIDARQEGGIEG